MEVVKINGQVNKYTLNIDYPVTQHDDPNFFEKIFSFDMFWPKHIYNMKPKNGKITRTRSHAHVVVESRFSIKIIETAHKISSRSSIDVSIK